MNDDGDFRQLLQRSKLAVLIATALVAFCYFFVDRPVAFFVHDCGISHDTPVLLWLTYPPPLVQSFTPAVLVLLMVRRAWGPLRRWEQALLAASIALIVADQFRVSLAVLFGRYWPETWIDQNPSLIGDGAYGFHPFATGRAYQSFPSGHTTRVTAAAAVVWLAYPRWRWACVVVTLAVAVGLIGMNFHFVGDVVAGCFLGSIVGVYAAKLAHRTLLAARDGNSSRAAR